MKQMKNIRKKWAKILVSLFAVLIVACGSGGNSSTAIDNGSSQPVSGSVSGTATKGPVSDATMKAFAINADGTKGEIIGTGMTDSNGDFLIHVGDHSGPVLIEMTGGHYADEATGIIMNMMQDNFLTCLIPFHEEGATLDGVQVTPVTSMAHAMARDMHGGITQANVRNANHAVGQYFHVNDILYDYPINPVDDGSGVGAEQDEVHYGMVLAAMSQYAHTLGLSHSPDIVNHFMDDAVDGQMDGRHHGNHINMGGGMMGGHMMHEDAGTEMLADAMEDFIHSPMNRSGITLQEMQTLIDALHSSSGAIQ